MVNADDSGLCSIERAGFAGAVDADVRAGAVSFGDGGGEFGFGVLKGCRPLVIDELVAAGLVDFGEVGAALALLAHDVDEVFGGVGVIGVGEDVLGGVVAYGVLVAAGDVDGVAGDPHAGAGDFAAVDGVADGDVGAARAFGAHVALGGEAGEEVGLGSSGGDQSTLRDGLLYGLQVFGARMEEEVNVSVDEAGHQCGVAEVNHLRASRMRDMRADFADAIACDEHFTRGDDLAGRHVEDARGMEDGGLRRGAALLRDGAGSDQR